MQKKNRNMQLLYIFLYNFLGRNIVFKSIFIIINFVTSKNIMELLIRSSCATGLIVPDLPYIETSVLRNEAIKNDIELVCLITRETVLLPLYI